MLEKCIRIVPSTRINKTMTSNTTCSNPSGGCGRLICNNPNEVTAYKTMDCNTTTTWTSSSYPAMPIELGWKSGDKDRTYTLDTVSIKIETLKEVPTKIKIFGGRGELDSVVWNDIAFFDLVWSEDFEKQILNIDSQIPYHSYKIAIEETNNLANNVTFEDIGFYGKNKYCLEKADWEELFNADFNCGTLSWETNAATLKDLGNSLVSFDVFSTDGSLTHAQELNLDSSKEYFLNVVVTNSSGTGYIRIYLNDGTYLESQFIPNIKDYAMFADNIKNIVIAADGDIAFEAILDKISLQEVVSAEVVIEGTDIVSIDGEIVLCKI